MLSSARLAVNLQGVRDRIAKAAESADRDPAGIQLLPITKSVGVETIARLMDLGELAFGENRAQVLQEKADWFADRGLNPAWHFIGPLQRNKARRVLQVARVLHSVGSLRLIQTLGRIAEEDYGPQTQLGVFLQAWLTGEDQKQGFPPDQLEGAVLEVMGHKKLQLEGLMTMGPRMDSLQDGSHEEATRQVFETLALKAATLWSPTGPGPKARPCRLSMGMSGDLEWAIAAGSHLVRVGSDLFR